MKFVPGCGCCGCTCSCSCCQIPTTLSRSGNLANNWIGIGSPNVFTYGAVPSGWMLSGICLGDTCTTGNYNCYRMPAHGWLSATYTCLGSFTCQLGLFASISGCTWTGYAFQFHPTTYSGKTYPGILLAVDDLLSSPATPTFVCSPTWSLSGPDWGLSSCAGFGTTSGALSGSLGSGWVCLPSAQGAPALVTPLGTCP